MKIQAAELAPDGIQAIVRLAQDLAQDLFPDSHDNGPLPAEIPITLPDKGNKQVSVPVPKEEYEASLTIDKVDDDKKQRLGRFTYMCAITSDEARIKSNADPRSSSGKPVGFFKTVVLGAKNEDGTMHYYEDKDSTLLEMLSATDDHYASLGVREFFNKIS